MKKLYYLLLSVALVAFSASCSDDTTDDGGNVLPPKIEAVEGIAENYEVGLHEFLEITPEVKIDNENADALTYEWNINNQKVSEEKNLSYKLNELGEFNAFFKVISEKGAKIVDFKIRVASPYDRGLLLLSETNSGAMLTFKRLDVMEAKASPFAFADNNPTLQLGKKAMAINWMGNGLIDYSTATDDDLDVVICTNEPTTVYRINSKTLQVKNQIQYNLDGQEFAPENVIIPYGFQAGLNEAFRFIGGGKEFVMDGANEFIAPYVDPEMYNIAPLAAVNITDNTDMQCVYFDMNSRTILWYSGIMGMVMDGTKVFAGEEPIFMASANGIYRDEESADYRYEPGYLIMVTKSGESTKFYKVLPCDFAYDETVEVDLDASGHILPNSAIGVNPIKPELYYSRDNGIYRLNWDGGNFDQEPYIKLADNFEVKQITLNQYDENTLYIAAEDKNAVDDFKASLFIYDIKDKGAAKLLFENHKVGGSVKQLLYKGNAKENMVRHDANSGIKSLFR